MLMIICLQLTYVIILDNFCYIVNNVLPFMLKIEKIIQLSQYLYFMRFFYQNYLSNNLKKLMLKI